jgi:hypothetical protein
MTMGFRIALALLCAMCVASLTRADEPKAKKGETKAQEALRRFDKNNNGKLDPNEMLAARNAAKAERDEAKRAKEAEGTKAQNAMLRDFLKRFDANGNGQLDAMEANQMQRAMAGPAGGGATGSNAKGGSSINPSLLKKYDANRNGRLEPSEAQAIKDDLVRGRLGSAPTGAGSSK